MSRSGRVNPGILRKKISWKRWRGRYLSVERGLDQGGSEKRKFWCWVREGVTPGEHVLSGEDPSAGLEGGGGKAVTKLQMERRKNLLSHACNFLRLTKQAKEVKKLVYKKARPPAGTSARVTRRKRAKSIGEGH